MADAAVGDSATGTAPKALATASASLIRAHQALSQLNLDGDAAKHKTGTRDVLASTVRKNHRARDITHDFSEACKELKTGELVQHSSFTLWGSVQAVEIMDPKMDSGYVAPGESFDSAFDVGRNLLPEELLYIMDRIVRLETAWMRGFALFQTLFTSNHIWHLLRDQREPLNVSFPVDPEQEGPGGDGKWLHLVLLAYCVSTIIQCDMILELVTSQQYYEEEDLNTQLYQVRLLNDVTDEQAQDLLDQAIAWVASRGDDRGDELTPVEEAILDRLELRRGCQIRMLLSSRAFDADGLLDWVDAIEASADLAKDVPAAFNDKQHRKMSTAAPVRGLAILSLADACADLRNLFGDVDMQNHFVLEYAPWQNPPSLRFLLWTLASRTPRPQVVTRAALQNHLFAQGGPLDGPANIRDYMLAELAEQCFPDDALTDGTFFHEDFAPGSAGMRIRQRLEEWVQAAQPASLDVLRALCQNHCRVRRSLVNATRSLASLAAQFAPPAPTAPLSAMRDPLALLDAVLSNAAAQRRWHVAAQTAQLALAHDLHAPHELPSAYARLAAHHARSAALQEAQLALLSASAATPPPLPFRPPAPAARAAKLAYLRARMSLAHALGLAARAFACTHAALLQAALLEPASRAPRCLTTPALQAELRARDFAGDEDGEDDVAGLALARPVHALLADAHGALGEARALLSAARAQAGRDGQAGQDGEEGPAARAVGRACGLGALWAAQAVRDVRAVVECGVAVAALRGAVGKDGVVRGVGVRVPAPEGRSCAEWAVPVVTRGS